MVYRAFFDAVFASVDPEKAHERGVAAIRAGRFASRRVFPQTHAPRTVMGVEFPNAFGLAAGFDKNARAVPGLLALGFGHVEIGTVTARAQPGNPRPRLFRLVDDHALVDGRRAVTSGTCRCVSLRRTQPPACPPSASASLL